MDEASDSGDDDDADDDVGQKKLPARISNVQCNFSTIALNDDVIARADKFVLNAQLLEVRTVDLIQIYLAKTERFPLINLALYEAAARVVGSLGQAKYATPSEKCSTNVNMQMADDLFNVMTQDGFKAPKSGVHKKTLDALRFACFKQHIDTTLSTRVVCPIEVLDAFIAKVPYAENVIEKFFPIKLQKRISDTMHYPAMYAELNKIYREIYEPILMQAGDTEVVRFTNMTQHVVYAGTMWVANTGTNMQEHFEKHLRKFVGAYYDEHFELMDSSSEDRKDFKSRMWRTTNDIMFRNWSKVSEVLGDEIQRLLPPLPIDHNIFYHLKANPIAFVQCALSMQRYTAQMKNKPLSVLSEPECNIPGFVKFDQKLAALHLLSDEAVKLIGVSRSKLSSSAMYKKIVWAHIIKTDMRRFERSDLEFSGSISSDAVGVSIQLVTKGYKKGDMLVGTEGKGPPETYVDDEKLDKSVFIGKTIVGIDTNMRDLLYASAWDDENDLLLNWRFTSMQRRLETGEKHFRKVRENLRKQPLKGCNGWSAEDIERSLPPRHSATLEGLLARIVARTTSSVLTRDLYRQKKWRSMRASGKLKKQRCDAHMVKSFATKFGSPEKVVVAFGDSSNPMRHHRPAKRKGYRKVLRKADYIVLLVDECRTSKSCALCDDGTCETFRTRMNPRPYARKKHPIVEVHGLLICQDCSTLWNRDVLASVNMVKIAMAASSDEARPERFKKRPRS